ncbi:Transcription elongation factor GreB [Cronobacter muytjensii 530]
MAAKTTSLSTLRWRALLKKEEGDVATVQTPGGEATWYVNAIEYVK